RLRGSLFEMGRRRETSGKLPASSFPHAFSFSSHCPLPGMSHQTPTKFHQSLSRSPFISNFTSSFAESELGSNPPCADLLNLIDMVIWMFDFGGLLEVFAKTRRRWCSG
ncbi:hypothetical protein Droror1_Dr00016251, partial [Drosera rotundifolia]